MESNLAQWVIDLSSLFSILGFVVTCFLLYEAREIKKSFMRKARIPEIVSDLERVFGDLLGNLQEFSGKKREIHENIVKATGLLESITPKLDKNDVEKISKFVADTKLSLDRELSEDLSWSIYSQLSGVITYLQQLAKDTRLN